jgi:hypothetical protein
MQSQCQPASLLELCQIQTASRPQTQAQVQAPHQQQWREREQVHRASRRS